MADYVAIGGTLRRCQRSVKLRNFVLKRGILQIPEAQQDAADERAR